MTLYLTREAVDKGVRSLFSRSEWIKGCVPFSPLRYCPPARFENDELQASAFLLRRKRQEVDLSVNWLEFLDRIDRNEQIRLLQQNLQRKLTIATNARLVVMNVGRLRAKVVEGSDGRVILEVLHVPMSEDPSHSGIFGIESHESDDQLIAELLLEVVEAIRYPARIV